MKKKYLHDVLRNSKNILQTLFAANHKEKSLE